MYLQFEILSFFRIFAPIDFGRAIRSLNSESVRIVSTYDFLIDHSHMGNFLLDILYMRNLRGWRNLMLVRPFTRCI